jgi:ABC-2 type transport system ATP-binding protein
MIDTKALTARSFPVALAPLTITLGPGVHALLGGIRDGAPLVLAAIAGRARPRGGTVRVLGKPPGEVRASIAYVPRDAVLPDALRVDEALDLAASIRGEPAAPAADRLGALGVAPLATRRIATLAPGEARAIAMTEALTSRAQVILLDEPFVGLDPRAAALLAARARARASEGACVLVSTASVRDAADMGEDQLLFDRGVLVETRRAPRGASLSLAVSDVPRLLPALAVEPAIVSIESGPTGVVVRGVDTTELAAAVGRAVVAADVELFWLRAEAPALEELRG